MNNYTAGSITPSTSEIMSKHLITVHVEDSMRKAYQLMLEHKIGHLPVTDETAHVVGILSDRDVKRAMLPKSGLEEAAWEDSSTEFNPEHKVYDFMSWPVKTIDENCPVLDVVRIMMENKISAMIVVSNQTHGVDYPRGIVTTEDLLKLLASLLSSGASGKVQRIAHIELMHKVL